MVMNVSLLLRYRQYLYTAISNFCAKVFYTLVTVFESTMHLRCCQLPKSLVKKTHSHEGEDKPTANDILVATTVVFGPGTFGHVKTYGFYRKKNTGNRARARDKKWKYSRYTSLLHSSTKTASIAHDGTGAFIIGMTPTTPTASTG